MSKSVITLYELIEHDSSFFKHRTLVHNLSFSSFRCSSTIPTVLSSDGLGGTKSTKKLLRLVYRALILSKCVALSLFVTNSTLRAGVRDAVK